jgi:hypothetical protein
MHITALKRVLMRRTTIATFQQRRIMAQTTAEESILEGRIQCHIFEIRSISRRSQANSRSELTRLERLHQLQTHNFSTPRATVAKTMLQANNSNLL